MNEPIVVEYTRGSLTESWHRVHALWVDEKGREVRSWGDPDLVVCPRSSLKPVQALPLALSKGFEVSPDPMKALALACASHEAEDRHVDFVRAWLPMLNHVEDDLVCGLQPPEGYERIRYLIEMKKPLGRAFNNCSGKHTGMLAACRALGFESRGYHEWTHPLQKRIRAIATELSGIDWDRAPYGIDGCGLPNYFVPLQSLARMFRHFLEPGPGALGEAIGVVLRAWTREPYMIAGSGDVASELAHLTQGRVLAKIGAQGNFMALDRHRGRALVLKVEDGAARAAEESLLALLGQAGSISADEERALRHFVPRELRNWAGDVVGGVNARL